MTPDRELLRLYSEASDEAAFAELVHRHLPVVYAAALRLLSGNAELAKDVAQDVFTDLARKAGWLSNHPTLVGWLHTSTRFRASKAIRAESRRQAREQEAALMTDHPTSPITSALRWEQLRPKLDEALGQLSETDRNAVLLRFFQDKSFTEVAAILDLNESVAHKRVERAMEKMRRYFACSGFAGSAALLATTLDAQTVASLPEGLAVQVAETALAKTPLAATATSAALLYALGRVFFMSTKIKIVSAVIVVILGVWWFLQPTPAPVKVAAATAKANSFAESKYPIDPKSPALHPPPLAPMVAPPAQPHSPQPPNSATSSTADPQDDLKTALADMAKSLRSEDYAEYIKYELTKLDPATLQQRIADLRNAPPSYKQTGESLAQDLESAYDATPTFNTNGDEATFKVVTHNGNMMYTFTLVMSNINGKWYITKSEKAGESE